MQELTLTFPRGPVRTRVFSGAALLGEAAGFIAATWPGRRVAVIADAAVAALYADGLLRACEARALNARLFTFPPGEASKCRASKERIEDEMFACGFGRDSVVAALGGGVTGDLAGFTAATFCRGVPYVQIPTTVLAMADSSIGGKTGVDVPAGKNMIGAFHQPDAVFMDPGLLATLPPREIRAGLVEIVKHALIRDRALFTALGDELAALLAPGAHPDAFGRLLLRSCAIKAEVAAADETEDGLRQILNFGHTAGHAIEALSGWELLHGEAVALGIRAALGLSVECAGMAPGEAAAAAALLDALGMPPRRDFSIPAVLDLMRADKKARGGAALFVLLDAIGRVRERTSPVPDDALRRALAAIGGRP